MHKLFLYILLFIGLLAPAILCADGGTGTSAGSVAKAEYALQEELSSLESAALQTTYSHWSETIIPGNPEKGKLLYSWFMILVVYPVFGVLLIWGVVQSLHNEGYIDYGDIVKRLLLFAVFTGFSSLIFAYLSGIQNGMSRIINFVQTADIGAISDMLYAEDGSSNARLKRNISMGIEDAKSALLDAAKGQVRYKNYQNGETLAPFAVYMMFPLAVYNEGLALQDSKRGKLPSTESCLSFSKASDTINQDLSYLSDSDTSKSLLHNFAVSYAQLINNFPKYPTAGWKGESNMRARESFQTAYQKLYGVLEVSGTDKKFDKADDAPYTEVVYSLLGETASKHRLEGAVKFCKAQIEVFIQNPLIMRDINLIVWGKYHDGDISEVESLSLEKLEEKMSEVTKVAGKDGESSVKNLSLGRIDEIRQEVANAILKRAADIGALTPAIKDGKTYSPDAWTDYLASGDSLWDAAASLFSGAVNFVSNAIGALPQILFGWIVNILDYIASAVQRLITFCMTWLMAIFLSLQFFLACLTSCMLGSKKTESVFYATFKVCLVLALVPFTCNLLIGVFNMIFNSAMSWLIGPPGVTFAGATSIVIAGAKSAGVIAGNISIMPMIAIGIFCSLFQIITMVFLAVYSVKAAKILIQGGSIAGALAAVAGGALAAGTLAAKIGAEAFAGPAGSSLAGAAGKAASAATGFSDGGGNSPGGDGTPGGGEGGKDNEGSGNKASIPGVADPNKGGDSEQNNGKSDEGGDEGDSAPAGSPSNTPNSPGGASGSIANKGSDSPLATGTSASSGAQTGAKGVSTKDSSSDKPMSFSDAIQSNKATAAASNAASKLRHMSPKDYRDAISSRLKSGGEKIKSGWKNLRNTPGAAMSAIRNTPSYLKSSAAAISQGTQSALHNAPSNIKSAAKNFAQGSKEFGKGMAQSTAHGLGVLGRATWNVAKKSLHIPKNGSSNKNSTINEDWF